MRNVYPLHHLIRLSVVILLAGLVFGAARLSAKTSGRLSSPSLATDCPMHSAADWQSFLEESIDDPSWVETCEDSKCDARFAALVQTHIQNLFQRCRGQIKADPKIQACTENLRQLVPTWLRQHDSTTYGFHVDNHVYLGGQDAADKPSGMMKIPDAIVAALPDQKKVQEVARRNGWKYLTHDSALAGVRTFVVIQDPEGRFDQWMLLNLKSSSDKHVELNMPVSVVAVQKKEGNGNPLERVRLHFRDYSLSEIEGKVKLSVNMNGNGKCYSCHSNGMRQLIPRITQTLVAEPVRGELGFDRPAAHDFAYWRLVEFNQLIRQYGTNDWNGMIDNEQLGPHLGEKQACTTCHNGASRAPITVFTSTVQLRKKLVDELSMPPDFAAIRRLEQSEMHNPPLSAAERTELIASTKSHEEGFDEFMASRLPTLRDWVLTRSCL